MLQKFKINTIHNDVVKFYVSRIILSIISIFLKYLFIKIHGFEIYGKITVFYVTSSLFGLLIFFRFESILINLDKKKAILILKQIQPIIIVIIILILFILNIVNDKNYYLICIYFAVFTFLRSLTEIFLNKYKSYNFNLKKLLFNELNNLILIFLFLNSLNLNTNLIIFTTITILIEFLFLIFFITKTLNFKLNFSTFNTLNFNLNQRLLHSLFSRLFYFLFYRLIEIKYNLSIVGFVRFIEQLINFNILFNPFKNIIIKNLFNFKFLKKKFIKYSLILNIILIILIIVAIVCQFFLSFDNENIKNLINFILLFICIFPLNLSNSFIQVNEAVFFFMKKEIMLIYYSFLKLFLISYCYLFDNLGIINLYVFLSLINIFFIYKFLNQLKKYVV